MHVCSSCLTVQDHENMFSHRPTLLGNMPVDKRLEAPAMFVL